MAKYDDTYQAVVNMAKVKMIMNKHKGKIEDCPIDTIIEKAVDELTELASACEKGDYLNIIEEVADVLNFTIAAAHVAMNGYRDRKKCNIPIHETDYDRLKGAYDPVYKDTGL